MKKYLLIDMYSDIAKKCTYKEIEGHLIKELKCDISDNINEYNIKDIIEYNFNVIEKILSEKSESKKIKLIKENLEGFGWDIKKINEIKEELWKKYQ